MNNNQNKRLVHYYQEKLKGKRIKRRALYGVVKKSKSNIAEFFILEYRKPVN